MDTHPPRAWVEVDLGALVRNAETLQRSAQRPLLPMIKADAYGLGAVRVACALEAVTPFGYGVATIDEARELRRAGVERRLFLFTPVRPSDYAAMRELGVTPTLGSGRAIQSWVESGGGAWHLAIDTGMHRAGVEWWNVGTLSDVLRASPPEGAYTHFHSADRNDGSMSQQTQRFRDALRALPVRPPLAHAENSAAIERNGVSEWDLVRPGVFLYGVGGGPGSRLHPEPVAHLRAPIVELHRVRDGETVSYGGTWRADGDRVVGTLAVGYADGYRRVFSSLGEGVVRGVRVPVVGRVTMDMTMVDVTGVACAEGDEVTLLGRGEGDTIDINALCDRAQLLAYELLVGLRLRAERRYAGAPPAFNVPAVARHGATVVLPDES